MSHIYLVPASLRTEAAISCFGFGYDKESGTINEIMPLYQDVNDDVYSDLTYDALGRIVSFTRDDSSYVYDYDEDNIATVTVRNHSSGSEYHCMFDQYGNMTQDSTRTYEIDIDEYGNLTNLESSEGLSRSYENTYDKDHQGLLLCSSITRGYTGMDKSENIDYQYYYFPEGKIDSALMIANIKRMMLWKI